MAPKRKGVPALLDRAYGLIDAMSEKARNGDKFAIYNPPLARQRHQEIISMLQELRTLIEDEFEPHLERANPPVEKRLADLEARLERLEDQAPPDRIHLFERHQKRGNES